MFLGFENRLTSLQLECNQIGDAGAQAMARCLTHNVHMQSINLTHNCITQVGKCISLLSLVSPSLS